MRPFLSISSLLLAAASSVGAQSVIYDNGPWITNPNGGSGGIDASALQNVAPINHTTYGFTANNVGFTLADDFTVCGQWSMSSINLHAYQTNAGSGTFTGVFARIWRTDPRTGNAATDIIWGDTTATMTTNLVTTPPIGTLRAYRTLVSDFATNTARQVQNITVSFTPVLLQPGTYWLEYGLTGSSASGPFVPPLTETDVQATGNGMQRAVATGVWTVVNNGAVANSGCGFPFQILGTSAGQILATASAFGAGKAGTNGVGAWDLGASPVRTPAIGRDFPMRLVNGVAGQSPICAIGTAFPTGLPLPPIATIYLNPIITTFTMPAFSAANVSSLRLPIPHGANLCGLSLGFQAFWGDTGAPGFIGHSDGLSLTLGN